MEPYNIGPSDHTKKKTRLSKSYNPVVILGRSTTTTTKNLLVKYLVVIYSFSEGIFRLVFQVDKLCQT